MRRGIPAPPSPLVLPPLIKNLYFVPFSLFPFFLRYAVEGTLAAEVKNEPDQIPTMEGRMIPRKCAVKYVYLYLNGLYGKRAYYGQNKLLNGVLGYLMGVIHTRTFHLKHCTDLTVLFLRYDKPIYKPISYYLRYISFSAHADYPATREFIEQVR